ncbi:unnamed protein product [Lymnaea stagnalis]|uniref:Uncharacterized protein n=1 Tax=Lymnaea stagnalis TaxID=6523 RepID=A0AAV2I4Z1_LYMST
MSHFNAVFVVMVSLILQSECQLYNLLSAFQSPNPYSGSPLFSFASQMPGSHQNAIGADRTASQFPSPQAPQVLLNAFKNAQGPPPGAAPLPNPMSNMMNMIGGMGGHGLSQPHGGAGGHGIMPISGGMKQMVVKWATQLGHKAYYEAHGCVDPSTTLHGRHGQMASMAMMWGCASPQAGEVCDLAQMVHGGAQGANMRLMMEYMMPKQTKNMLEQCLTPSAVMKGFMGSMAPQPQPKQEGPPPPIGAEGAPPSGQSAPVDCSSISQMLMMSPSAAEGVMSPENMEQIATMRNRYLKMSCQENMLMGTLPYRMCCPGYVRPPTMEEAMMARGMAVAA